MKPLEQERNKYNMKKIILTLLSVITISGMAQSIQLHYSGENKNLIKAVVKANEILVSSEFYKQIESKKQFDNSNYSGIAIANEIKNFNKIIEINVSNVDADINIKSTDLIIFNSTLLNSLIGLQINTLLHELVHVVDWKTNSVWNYSHQSINPIDQIRTAPNVVGKIGENIINGTFPKIN